MKKQRKNSCKVLVISGGPFGKSILADVLIRSFTRGEFRVVTSESGQF